MHKTLLYTACIALGITAQPAHAETVAHTDEAPAIDGNPSDSTWQKDDWRPLAHSIIGPAPAAEDFSGRYKLVWDKDHLYVLAEITDDVLYDRYANPRERYWDDDCLEIFIDEDASGGDHLFTHNAFAYHVALDNQSVDMGAQNEDGSADILILNDHIKSSWKRSSENPNHIYWELAVSIYNDAYTGAKNDIPIELFSGKKIGFMLAYCDNDGSEEREHFIGSKDIEPINGDKNLGYKDASVFATLTLVD